MFGSGDGATIGTLRDALAKIDRLRVGDRTYKLIPRQTFDEATGWDILNEGRRLKANMGEEDGQYILDHQDDMHWSLQSRVAMYFPDWNYLEGDTGVEHAAPLTGVLISYGDEEWGVVQCELTGSWAQPNGYFVRRIS